MAGDALDTHRFPTNSAVEKRLEADAGFSWDGQCGGLCPVIVEFIIDGFHAQFRARDSHWSVAIAVHGVIDPANENEEFFKIESHYAAGSAAGYIPAIQALEFVETSIRAFRRIRSLTN